MDEKNLTGRAPDKTEPTVSAGVSIMQLPVEVLCETAGMLDMEIYDRLLPVKISK